jgi:hypothetical protein
MSRDRLDVLLEACNPVERAALTTDGLDRALDELGVSISSRSRRGRRRSIGRPRLVLLVGAAALVVGVAIAAGAVLTAHTGLFPSKAEEAMGGPGEALNPAAPDFRDVALQIASDIPYPKGYESWRDFLISDEIRTDAGDGVVSSGALHGWFAASAFCAWTKTWRRADVAGDREAATRAASVISQAPGWKAIIDEDPHPDPSGAGDLGSTYTLFGWMLPYRDAVLAGDRGRVDHLLAAGYGDKCWTSDPAWRAQLTAHPNWLSLSQRERAQKYLQFLASGRS